MCLDAISRTKLDKEEQSGIGYKVISKIYVRQANKTYYETCGRGIIFKKNNRWVHKEKSPAKIEAYAGKYKSGFHICQKITDARKYASSWNGIIQVKYRKAHTIGIQRNANIIVADEMRYVKVMRNCE